MKPSEILLTYCPRCGKTWQPALEQKREYDGEWDQHSFKCECSPGLIITIG